jgi:hypothetical protein
MKLSKEDADLFYKLWFSLLDYVNRKWRISDELPTHMYETDRLDPSEVKKVANHLYSDVTVIDEYLAEHTDMPPEHRELVSSWKRRVSGSFLVERHLKKGTIFMSGENNDVYQVVGLISSWEEILHDRPMPVLLDATLLPFRDVIISDGIVMVRPIIIGGGMAEEFKRQYMDAKKAGKIHKTL